LRARSSVWWAADAFGLGTLERSVVCRCSIAADRSRTGCHVCGGARSRSVDRFFTGGCCATSSSERHAGSPAPAAQCPPHGDRPLESPRPVGPLASRSGLLHNSRPSDYNTELRGSEKVSTRRNMLLSSERQWQPRSRSSAGLEHLPSKQRVAGSNPAGIANDVSMLPRRASPRCTMPAGTLYKLGSLSVLPF
jgi:hypothetical protein